MPSSDIKIDDMRLRSNLDRHSISADDTKFQFYHTGSGPVIRTTHLVVLVVFGPVVETREVC